MQLLRQSKQQETLVACQQLQSASPFFATHAGVQYAAHHIHNKRGLQLMYTCGVSWCGLVVLMLAWGCVVLKEAVEGADGACHTVP